MDKEFRAGKRFTVIKLGCALVNVTVVLCFYLIYRFLLAPSWPAFADGPILLLIFLVISAAVVKFTFWLSDRYANMVIRYRVTQDALVVGDGPRQQSYPWSRFRSVRLLPSTLLGVLPIVFQLDEGKLALNHYVADIYRLAEEILEHTQPYMTVDPQVREQLGAMSGVF